MRQKYLDTLATFLGALEATGKQFPQPTVSESKGGWVMKVFHEGRGLSIVCHDYSYGLETAEIVGTPEAWEFADADPCTQVVGHREPADVAADLVKICHPQLLN